MTEQRVRGDNREAERRIKTTKRETAKRNRRAWIGSYKAKVASVLPIHTDDDFTSLMRIESYENLISFLRLYFCVIFSLKTMSLCVIV